MNDSIKSMPIDEEQKKKLKTLLEKLDERFASGQISEHSYKELKEKYITQLEDLFEIELLEEVGLEQPPNINEDTKKKLETFLEKLDERFVQGEIREDSYKELKEMYTTQLRYLSEKLIVKKLIEEIGLEQSSATDEEQKRKLETFLEKLDERFVQGEIREDSYKELKEMYTTQLNEMIDKLAKLAEVRRREAEEKYATQLEDLDLFKEQLKEEDKAVTVQPKYKPDKEYFWSGTVLILTAIIIWFIMQPKSSWRIDPTVLFFFQLLSIGLGIIGISLIGYNWYSIIKK